MINSVEGGREIKKGKKSDVFVIQSRQYDIVNFQECSFCAVIGSIGRLKVVQKFVGLKVFEELS